MIDKSRQFAAVAYLTRVWVPIGLWILVGIAGPAFVYDLCRSNRAIQEDFAVYYVLGQELREGIDPYTTDFAISSRLNGLNIHAVRHGSEPPTFIGLVCDPLSRFPIRTAYWIWQIANLACLIITVYLLVGPGTLIATWTRLSVVALTALYPPLVTHIWMGQSKLPALLLLTLTMRWLEQRRDQAAGLTLAFASLLRFFPLALGGYLLLQKRWRAFFYTSLGVLVGGAITIAFVGIQNCVSFITAAALLVDQSWTDTARDISIDTFISRQLREVLPHSTYFVDITALGFNILGKLLVLIAATRATLRYGKDNDRDSRVYALWVATSILLLPVVWDYDLTLMLIPFGVTIAVASRDEASRRTIAMAMVSYVLLIFWDYLIPTRYECGFFAMVTAFLSSYWLAIDRAATSSKVIASTSEGDFLRSYAPTA